MEERSVLWSYLRRALLPAVCILLVGYFAYHAVAGPTGVIAWRGYKSERAKLEQQVAERAEARAALDRQVKLLDPRGVDPDLADELVRKNLNVVKPDEIIVPLGENEGMTAPDAE